MGKYLIRGGRRLSGEIAITGGKNAVLPILAATVLNGNINVINNCPRLLDVFAAKNILESIGCMVKWDDNSLIVDSSAADCYKIPENLMREMRSSIIFLGSVIARFGKAKISFPGGCELGPRPIDLHVRALKQLGVEIIEEKGCLICSTNKLRGAVITLDFPSVGATENILLASIFAEGRTVISNAAKEPEIVDLQNFLNAMGAKIYGAGSDTIIINGVKNLNAVTYKVMPDRIVAGTYLIAAAITGGSVTLKDVRPGNLHPLITRLKDTGCVVKEEVNSIFLKAPPKLKPLEIVRTHPHPGFPTDMQPQLMSLLTLAEGTSIIIETVFESRFKHVPELQRMGAHISTDNRSAVVKGVKELSGNIVTAKDLRGGAALILAGLAANGETTVLNSAHIERGYENIENTLVSLGADIVYVNED